MTAGKLFVAWGSPGAGLVWSDAACEAVGWAEGELGIGALSGLPRDRAALRGASPRGGEVLRELGPHCGEREPDCPSV